MNRLIPLLWRTCAAFLCLGVCSTRVRAAGAPAVTGFSPSSGPVGTHVTINGVNFTPPVTVTFGGGVRSAATFTPTETHCRRPRRRADRLHHGHRRRGARLDGRGLHRVGRPPPAITSATGANATVGVAFNYQITATNNPTAYAATGLPAGLSLDTASGLITGSPVGSAFSR